MITRSEDIEYRLGKLKEQMRHAPCAQWWFEPLPIGLWYYPIAPCADFEELADLGRRIVLVQGSYTDPKTEFRIANKGELYDGWVLGVIA